MLPEQIVLILDSRGVLADTAEAKPCNYWNTIEQGANLHIITADKLENTEELIEKYEPDIILVYDNFNKDITAICTEIRNKKSLHRPIIVVISHEISLEKKLEVIQAGADDFQNIDLNDEELSIRIFAHLRRHAEVLSDTVTKLPVANTVYKMIKRNIGAGNSDFLAVMYLNIDNYSPYKEIYGYIATEKLIKTFIAIVKTSINENDFIGQLNENGYIILTTPQKAEKIATFLSYSFDSVAPKFYSKEDSERGYILLAGDDKIGRRMPFVSVSIGIASSQYSNFSSYQEALNSSISIQRLAKSKIGSCWLSDRPKISGGLTVEKFQTKILIAEKDEALSYLLATTLEMQGYIVEKINNIEEIINNIEQNKINLLLLDIPKEDSSDELDICRFLKHEYPEVKIIVSTVNRNKERVLDAGADLYIPKPYELMTLFSWIENFLTNKL